MGKKLLIDATHAEETRVVVVDGNKVEEFDFETIHKRQLAGNIYLAKVTRVEPSLQAAFVDYGGNRHGFLAFAEIHPDYYQIPVADREALLAEERELARASEEGRDEEGKSRDSAKDGAKEGAKEGRKPRRRRSRSKATGDDAQGSEAPASEDQEATVVQADTAPPATEGLTEVQDTPVEAAPEAQADTPDPAHVEVPSDTPAEAPVDTPIEAPQDAPVEAPVELPEETPVEAPTEIPAASGENTAENEETRGDRPMAASSEGMDQRTYGAMDVVDLDDEDSDEGETAKPADALTGKADGSEDEEKPFRAADVASELDDQIESVADEDVSDELRPPRRPRARRYKIQEVIKVRQIMLVQVVKEERGNKGAALTTYLSLAGRYCVLMPNTARGGGISRKITNAADRKKLKDIASEFDVPEGAGLIIRTAGANRTKTEIKRDYEYLFRLWEQIRDLTLKSIAPAPIYEEGNLIKRSIRDLYNKDIDEVLVEGAEGYRTAKDFMKMIMPSHAKNVKLYNEPMPLFARYQVESYLGSMFNPTVQLKSGGYIVIGVTEALVAIDVNSGKSTREGSIEDTALKTNLEAAEEVARQLRLRDLAGLIVIDFIDMEERKNNNAVEKRLKDALRNDRARIQVGRISGFGLLEMSRQRLRPGMIEVTTQPCPHCHGTGLIRSDNSLALQILRALEEEGTRNRSKEVLVKAPTEIINYLFNAKREHVAQIEARYGMAIRLEADPSLVSPDYVIEKFKTATRIVATPSSPVVSLDARTMSDIDDAIEAEADAEDETASEEAVFSEEDEGKSEGGKRKRRRRRRSRKGGQNEDANGDASVAEGNGEGDEAADASAEAGETPEPESETVEEAPKPRKRRSRSRKKPAESESDEGQETPAVASSEGGAEPTTQDGVAASAEEPGVEADAVAADLEAQPQAPAPVVEPDAPTASEADVETAGADSADETGPDLEAQPQAVATPDAVEAGSPDPAPQAEAAAPETTPEPEAGPKPVKPRRTGWWSRGR